jgi:hypothetical protein
LFVALGGTAWAAVTLPGESVGSKQIRKDAVRSTGCGAGGSASPAGATAVRFAEVGLVQGALFDPEVVDEAFSLGLDVFVGSAQVALANGLQTSGITTVAVRCTEDADAFLIARDVKLKALQVDSAIGP